MCGKRIVRENVSCVCGKEECACVWQKNSKGECVACNMSGLRGKPETAFPAAVRF